MELRGRKAYSEGTDRNIRGGKGGGKAEWHVMGGEMEEGHQGNGSA